MTSERPAPATDEVPRGAIRSLKDLPSQHLLGAGTAMCAGCGGLETVHQIYDLLGGKSVFVNAAGCMTLLASWPFTPFRGGFLYTAMASAAAGAQGVRDALDILVAKNRMPPVERKRWRRRPLGVTASRMPMMARRAPGLSTRRVSLRARRGSPSSLRVPPQTAPRLIPAGRG